MTEETPQTESEEMSDSEAILKIAQAMKDNAPSPDEKQNVFTLMNNVIMTEDTTKCGNLRDDKEYNELGVPILNVRGCLDISLIASDIMENDFFADYFKKKAENTLATSLSREGFLLKVAVTQTKQISDSTRKIKRNSGMFKKTQEISGGDINSPIPTQ
jgi:hypothetical protein